MAPEVWFEDFGSGRLSGGATTVSLDPRFTQTVNLPLGYHVFLTPKGDCKGLFVTGETNSGFEVRELSGGKSAVEFDYRIVAHPPPLRGTAQLQSSTGGNSREF